MNEELELKDDASILDADYDDEETDWRLDDNLTVVGSEESSAMDFGESIEDSEPVSLLSSAEETADEEEIRRTMSAALEGLLFLTGDEGITLEQAVNALGTDEETTKELFDELQKYYLDDSRGIEIAHFGETWRFLSKAAVHPYPKRLFSIDKESRLSNAALETLAIIAYRQPITRVEIEEIRGVGADMMLRKLEARGLICESGRSEAPGRPILYSVTEDFMDAFQLLSLDELPELPSFSEDTEGSDDLFGK
jgi:segregation and condensation protein B